MDNILEKSEVLDQLKYDLNGTNSDSDPQQDDDDFSNSQMHIKEETNIKREFDIGNVTRMQTDLILPESLSSDTPTSKAYHKKKERTKKELEEEEREKMQ